MKYGVVYRITNLETDKCYIGRTKNVLRKRWAQHCKSGSSCLHLKYAIQKYGKESFSICEIASSWDAESLKELERFLIEQENTLVPNGYNLMNGGEGGTGHNEETREKLRVAATGRIYTEETRKKLRVAATGKKHTEEARQNMSRIRKGKISPIKGRKYSDEAKKNMGGARVGAGRHARIKETLPAITIIG